MVQISDVEKTLHGVWTAQLARGLSKKYESSGLDVLFNHGDRLKDPEEKVGGIVSWFGPEYRRDTRWLF